MSRASLVPFIAALGLLGACATAAPEAGTSTPDERPATVRLGYASGETPATYTYEFADTTTSEIQAGAAGTINVGIGVRGVVDLAFEPAGSDQKVTITFTDFAGSMSNSASGGTVNAALVDVKGPAVVTLRPRGRITFVERPEVTASFRAVSGAEGVFRRLFVQLPNSNVQRGATWTDTLTIEETNEGLTTRTYNSIRSTWASDTVVGDRTLAVITYTADRKLDVTGTSQGVEIVQRLTGTANGTVLWDTQRRALVSRTETAQFTGTFDLPAMSMTNMPITARGTASVRLRDG
ncbi:MAG TPA: hypothetical protein VK864_15040 [Longimicrobiales bacterium]|nr:hypothetical protein [Longimicrobiales bacterium]